MLTEKTIRRVFGVICEIKTAKQILAEMEASCKANDDTPDSDYCIRLEICRKESPFGSYYVSRLLAMAILRAYIANEEKALAEANEQARIELSGDSTEKLPDEESEAGK